MGFQVEVWGEYALFTRPELHTERVSYDVPTPSAARGLLEAIFWHPGLRYHIDKIYVLNPIRFASIRRNEVSSKVSASNVRTLMTSGKGDPCIVTRSDIAQRASQVLRDVHYVIEAHFEMTPQASASDNTGKFSEMIHRRLEKGQCYHQPCFGCREFPAHFREWNGGAIPTAYPNEDRELGLMLFDIDYSDPNNLEPMFFRARLEKGVLNVKDCEVLR